MRHIRTCLFLVGVAFLLSQPARPADTKSCELLTYRHERVVSCPAAVGYVLFRQGTWQEAVERGLVKSRRRHKGRLLKELLRGTGLILRPSP